MIQEPHGFSFGKHNFMSMPLDQRVNKYMCACIHLYVLGIEYVLHSSLIKDTLKGRVKSVQVDYLLGCNDTLAFRRMLICNHPICDISLFLNHYED